MAKHEMTPEEALEMMKQLPRFIGVSFWEGVGFSPDVLLTRIQLGIGIMSAPQLTPMFNIFS